MRWISRSAEATREAARTLAACLDERGLVLALVGPLGAGKTVFVKGLAAGLGVDPRLVASPTFVIASEYPGPRPLAHVDLYRLESTAELEDAGFLDLLVPGAVVAIEWSDRLPDALPSDRLEVTIGPDPEGSATAREIRARGLGPASREVARRWQRRVEPAQGSDAESRQWG